MTYNFKASCVSQLQMDPANCADLCFCCCRTSDRPHPVKSPLPLSSCCSSSSDDALMDMLCKQLCVCAAAEPPLYCLAVRLIWLSLALQPYSKKPLADAMAAACVCVCGCICCCVPSVVQFAGVLAWLTGLHVVQACKHVWSYSLPQQCLLCHSDVVMSCMLSNV